MTVEFNNIAELVNFEWRPNYTRKEIVDEDEEDLQIDNEEDGSEDNDANENAKQSGKRGGEGSKSQSSDDDSSKDDDATEKGTDGSGDGENNAASSDDAAPDNDQSKDKDSTVPISKIPATISADNQQANTPQMRDHIDAFITNLNKEGCDVHEGKSTGKQIGNLLQLPTQPHLAKSWSQIVILRHQVRQN